MLLKGVRIQPDGRPAEITARLLVDQTVIPERLVTSQREK